MTTAKHREPESPNAPHRMAPSRKRRYVAPVLTEYGSVGKLTQGGSGAAGEGTSGMVKSMCL